MTRNHALVLLALLVLFSCSDEPTNTATDVDENGITTKGLIVRYKFDGDAKESFGTGLNGIVSSGVTFTPGRTTGAGSAARFNGEFGHIAITGGNISLLEPKEALTISFWIKGNAESGADQWTHIVSKAAGFDNGYVVKWSHDGVPRLIGFLVEGASGTTTPNDNVSTPNSPLIGGWNHVCLTWSKSTKAFSLYVNGIQADVKLNGIYNGSHSSDTLYVGGQPYLNAFGELVQATIPADLDDLRIYSRALSPAEITALSRENLQTN